MALLLGIKVKIVVFCGVGERKWGGGGLMGPGTLLLHDVKHNCVHVYYTLLSQGTEE